MMKINNVQMFVETKINKIYLLKQKQKPDETLLQFVDLFQVHYEDIP